MFDYSNGLQVTMRRAQYYRLGQMAYDDVWRYTPEEAARLHRETGRLGPWMAGWETMAL